MKARLVNILLSVGMLVSILAAMLVLAGCTSQSSTSPIENASPATPSTGSQTPLPSIAQPLIASSISLLMQVAPADNLSYLTYNSVPTLATYQDKPIPLREASALDKLNWWAGFESYVVASYSFPTFADIWGFDAVDLQGMLTAWYRDRGSLTVFSGGFELAKFREKLKSYGYSEENYLGYRVCSGIPPADTTNFLEVAFPRAFGIIDVVSTATDRTSLILMANRTAENDVEKAKATIQLALKAFHDKTALAYRAKGIAPLADSLGRVGAAFVANPLALSFEALPHADERAKYTGPGKLGAYEQLAVATRGKGEVLEFTLAYDSPNAASANAAVLEQRLKEGLSITSRALSSLWTVQEVKAEGEYLKAELILLPQTGGKFINFRAMIFNQDYLFLAPE